jgi:hypothetical protein
VLELSQRVDQRLEYTATVAPRLSDFALPPPVSSAAWDPAVLVSPWPGLTVPANGSIVFGPVAATLLVAEPELDPVPVVVEPAALTAGVPVVEPVPVADPVPLVEPVPAVEPVLVVGSVPVV